MKLVLIFMLVTSFLFANWASSDKKTPEEEIVLTQVDTQEELKGYLWLPENYSADKKYAAVVMSHGCGGAHYKDNPSQWSKRYISGKYKVWGKLLNKADIMVLMVDSFSTRDNNDVGKGVCSSSDPLARPEKIDPISVRPIDIASGIAYLKNRTDINPDKVGVLGFSNGGTSALVLANHENLVERNEALNTLGKSTFNLAFEESYKANTIVSLYPGCGLSGYSPETQGIFKEQFMTYTDTFLYIASNDTSLPDNTKEKCHKLRVLDSNKSYLLPSMKMKLIENTNHQFDYYENDEAPVIQVINRIIKIFESM